MQAEVKIKSNCVKIILTPTNEFEERVLEDSKNYDLKSSIVTEGLSFNKEYKLEIDLTKIQLK